MFYIIKAEFSKFLKRALVYSKRNFSLQKRDLVKITSQFSDDYFAQGDLEF